MSASSSSNLPRLEQHSVRFDLQNSIIHHYETVDNDAAAAWFHASELHAFRQDVIRNVRTIRQELAWSGTFVQEESEEDVCVQGIENLISVAMTRKLVAVKQEVANAVFREQNRQVHSSGFGKSTRIAHASEFQSRWSRDRALQLGLPHANVE